MKAVGEVIPVTLCENVRELLHCVFFVGVQRVAG